MTGLKTMCKEKYKLDKSVSIHQCADYGIDYLHNENFCPKGFTYQTATFLNLYWKYPSVVDIQVTNPYEFDLPAFTVCPVNFVRRSLMCKKYPEQCSKPKDVHKLCQKFPFYCKDGELEEDFLMVNDSIKLINALSRQEMKEMGQHYDDFISECFLIIKGHKNDCKELYNESSMQRPKSGYSNCFTFFASYGQPNRIPQKINMFNVVVLTLKVEPEEYIGTHSLLGIQLSIHNHASVVNPLVHGKFFEMNTKNIISISQVKRNLLPAPFESNCTDYLAKWRSRNGKGPITLEMCIQECALNTSVKKHGCADRRIVYPHWVKICPTMVHDFNENITLPCIHRCSPPCAFDEYELSITTGRTPESRGNDCKNSTNNNRNISCNSVNVIFVFNQMEVTTYTFKPKYEEIEIFSYIGGYVGIWLGISLCSLFGAFQYLFESSNCRCKRKKITRNQPRESIASTPHNISFGRYEMRIAHSRQNRNIFTHMRYRH